MSLRVLVAEKRYVSLPRAMLVRENTVVLYFIAGARPAVKFSSHSEGRRLQHLPLRVEDALSFNGARETTSYQS